VVKEIIPILLVGIMISSCIPGARKKTVHKQKTKTDNKNFSSQVNSNQQRHQLLQELHKNQKVTEVAFARQQEAKFSDIPIPLETMPLNDYFSHQNTATDPITAGYKTTMLLDEVTTFYLQQMERTGWRKVASVTGIESLLIFEKPDRVCAVSIRPLSKKHSNKQEVGIFIFVENNRMNVS